MEEILPNLLPAAFTLVMWLLSLLGKGATRLDRALTRGFFLAFIVTFVVAVPPFMLAASNGFRGLEMVWMLTIIMAVLGAGAGLVAFAVGFGWGWASKDEAARGAETETPP
jgi:hypothetical protein